MEDESSILMKYAFEKGVPILPGDMGAGRCGIMEFLTYYYHYLQNNKSITLEDSFNKWKETKKNCLYVELEDLKAEYKKLNDRDIPSIFEEIKKDLQISKSIPPNEIRGSNKLSDLNELHIRNMALLKALQLGYTNFGTITTFYGASHILEIGPTLEKEVGKIIGL